MEKTDLFDTRPKVKRHTLSPLPKNQDQAGADKAVGLGRFPSWLHRKLPKGNELLKTGKILSANRLHTVCEEAKCPDIFECWSKKTATFLVLGKECTRNCGFCDIDFTKTPHPPDANEPFRVAESVIALGLKHVVITMVARDDLPDGGAQHVADVMTAIRQQKPGTTLEVLTSDFFGNRQALDVILNARPEIFNHNIETVRDFTPQVRHTATYDRSLEVLGYMSGKRKASGLLVKSGLMVGFGETKEQIRETIRDLRDAGCDIITIGQYLQPNRRKRLVKEFVAPEIFKQYEDYGYSVGIKHMLCGPFVRSSYNAGLVFEKIDPSKK
jgi:lipoic acid synthetase